MEQFTRVEHGYNPDEVNAFLDKVIGHVEKLVNELKIKNAKVSELEELNKSNLELKERLAQYERMESTLNKAIFMAQKTSDQIKANTYRESELIIDEAKKNANRIINESLLRSEKIDMEAATLKRNVSQFKRRLKGIIEQQLEIVEDIEKVDF